MYNYTLMESYTLNFETLGDEEQPIHQIQEQFKRIEGRHLLASIRVSEHITLEHMLLIVHNLPPNFVGIDLLPFIANRPLEFLEKILVSLPPHIRYLNADHLITDYLNPLSEMSDQLPYDLFKKILPKVPKTINEFSFKNDLTRNLPGYLELIARYLPQLKSLDLQGNYLDQLHSKQISDLWINLPTRTSVLLLSFTPPALNYQRDTTKRDKILSKLPGKITQLILNVKDFRSDTHEQLHNCFGSLSSSVKKIQWTYEEIDEPFYLVELIKHTPKTVTILDLRDLDLGSLNYSAEDIKRGKPEKLIFELIKNIPTHVSTLLLDRNELDYLTTEEFILLISLIPSTVRQVSLKGNNLFTDKSPNQLEKMLEKIRPYNLSAHHFKEDKNRLLLDENDFKGKALAYPIIQIFNKDIFNQVGNYLNGPGFFQSANKENENNKPSSPSGNEKTSYTQNNRDKPKN